MENNANLFKMFFEKLIGIRGILSRNKIFSFLFPIPIQIILLIMGIAMTQATSNGQHINFFEWLLLVIICYIILIPILVVYWFLLGKRFYIRRIRKYCEPFLLECNRLSYTVNHTIDGDLFEKSFNTIKTNLILLAKYDKPGIFINHPIDDYTRITEGEALSRKKLHERILIANYDYDHMDGSTFENFCAELLRKNNYTDVLVTSQSRDQGIDIIAEKNGVKYGIQCKCYSSDIGNDAVQQVNAGIVFYKCHVGIVLTNKYFTPMAKQLAEVTNTLLWDRDTLNDLIVKSKQMDNSN